MAGSIGRVALGRRGRLEPIQQASSPSQPASLAALASPSESPAPESAASAAATQPAMASYSSLLEGIDTLHRRCRLPPPVGDASNGEWAKGVCPVATIAYYMLPHRAREKLSCTSAARLAEPQLDSYGRVWRRLQSSATRRMKEMELGLLGAMGAEVLLQDIVSRDLASLQQADIPEGLAGSPQWQRP